MFDCLEVQFDYQPGWRGSREEPPEEPYIDVEKAWYKGTDVSDIVDFDVIKDQLWEMRDNEETDY